MIHTLSAHWPAPTWIKAITTLRDADHSQPGDRLKLSQALNLQHSPVWLKQTHSIKVIEAKVEIPSTIEADGAWTSQPKVPCVVLTADCLPLLLCDTAGKVVAAVHAGWRGLLQGIIENAVRAMQSEAKGEIIAWLGPAIGQSCFEVGSEVRDQFIDEDLKSAVAFTPGAQAGKWLADLYALARVRLNRCAVTKIYGGHFCTYCEHSRFFSYRREKVTGRMATLIWIDNP